MTLATGDRPPFDETDAKCAAAYLAATGRFGFDPFAPGAPESAAILTTSLGDARLMMAESFGMRNAGGRAFRGYPMFVERPSPDAFAVDHDGLQICGVNIGLVTAAYELGLFVFAQREMFRDFGDAASERSPALPPDAALSYWISDRVRAGEGADGQPVGVELVPNDPQRQIGALYLALLMLRFVWLHELFHCLNGHTGYRARKGGETALHEISDADALSLVEVDERDGSSATISDGHCMEFDADRSAFWAMMKRQADGVEPIEGIRALPMPMRLRLTALAAILMTFLFDQAAQRRKIRAGGTHPLAYHRLHNLVRTWASHLTDPSGQSRKVFAHTVVEMDEFQGSIKQAISGTKLIHDLRSADLQQDFDEVEEVLIAVRLLFSGKAFTIQFQTLS